MGKSAEMVDGTVVVDPETAAKVVRRHPAPADPRTVDELYAIVARGFEACCSALRRAASGRKRRASWRASSPPDAARSMAALLEDRDKEVRKRAVDYLNAHPAIAKPALEELVQKRAKVSEACKRILESMPGGTPARPKAPEAAEKDSASSCATSSCSRELQRSNALSSSPQTTTI